MKGMLFDQVERSSKVQLVLEPLLVLAMATAPEGPVLLPMVA